MDKEGIEKELENLTNEIQEKMRARDLSDDYLRENNHSTREEIGIGEYAYGITMIPCKWVYPFLVKLSATITREKNKDKYIQQLETKVKELGKGQQTLIKSRAKWKARYYKSKRKKEMLELSNKLLEMTHKYDVNMIDKVKGEAVQIYHQRDELKKKLIQLKSKLKELNEQDKISVERYEEMRRNTTDSFYKKSYQTSIHKLNAKREVRQEILEFLEGNNGK